MTRNGPPRTLGQDPRSSSIVTGGSYMSKTGFVLLLIGGLLQTIRSVQLVLDPSLVALIVDTFNMVGGAFGFLNFGELIFTIIMFTSGITGILIIIGAILWFIYSYGAGGTGGKILAIIGVSFGIIALVLQAYYAFMSGFNFLDPVQLIGYIIGLGLGGVGVFVALVGLIIGGARETKPEREHYL